MSVHFEAARNRYVVRWRENGRNRSRRFTSPDDAEAFNDAIRGVPARAPVRTQPAPRGDGIYAYPTAAGVRFRFVFRQSDGSLSSRRGFTSRRAAAAARSRIVEAVARRELKPARETFGSFWTKLLAEKRPYMSAGSMQDFETHGRKRLVPAFGDVKLAQLDDDSVRDWLAEMVELVEAGELAPKTVNNARTCLSVACNVAVRRGLIPRNPCDDVPPLPVVQTKIDYLRLAEVEPYLDSCADFYRTLAETLIGTGARVSETTALRWPDLDLGTGIVRSTNARRQTGTARSDRRAAEHGRSAAGLRSRGLFRWAVDRQVRAPRSQAAPRGRAVR